MNIVKRCKDFYKHISVAFVVLLIVMIFPLTAIAHPTGSMGGHMMDEETREKMMEQGGQGYGPGYGWMGNMMGGGYGHMMGNMMGGGYGHMMGGMMGGGYGSMMGAFYQLDLTREQRGKIRDIQRTMHKKNIGLMEKIMDRSARLEDLYDSDKLDPDKIGKAYDAFFNVKRQMILRHVEARNKIYKVLSKDQREKFKSFSSFGHMGGMMMH